MSDYKEFTGKTLDEAIQEACRHYNMERGKLEIEILSGGSTGIFGLVGVKKASIKARPRGKFEPMDRSDSGRSDGGRSEGAKPEGAKAEASRPDASRDDAPRPERKARPRRESGEGKGGEGKAPEAKPAAAAEGGETAPGEKPQAEPGQGEERRSRRGRDGRRSRSSREARPKAEGESRPEPGNEPGNEAEPGSRPEGKPEGRGEGRGEGRSEGRGEGRESSRRSRGRGRGRRNGERQGERGQGERQGERGGERQGERGGERGGEKRSEQRERRPERRAEPRSESQANGNLDLDFDFEDEIDGNRLPPDPSDKPPLTNLSLLDRNKLESTVRLVVARLLGDLVQAPQLNVTIERDKVLVFIVDEENSGLIIGREGQTLSALQYLTTRIVSRKMDASVRVQLDTGDYRERQNDKLKEMAFQLAAKAISSGKVQSTRPLSSYHRRVVHLALQESEGVTTRSKGEGPTKRVLILPRKKG